MVKQICLEEEKYIPKQPETTNYDLYTWKLDRMNIIHNLCFLVLNHHQWFIENEAKRKKNRDQTQCYDVSPHTKRKFNNQLTTENATKISITQRFLTDLKGQLE